MSATSSVPRPSTLKAKFVDTSNLVALYYRITFALQADSALQNNEEEALRSWRNALDQIHYFNAYRVPPNYRPKSETEKALQDSLREMELQCKERVDLLEALRLSRIDSKPDAENSSSRLSAGKTNFITAPRTS